MAERRFAALDSPCTVALSGTRLVEAGAGTGKTWTLAALVLRLLLEQSLAIGEILVVTYTRAATGELKGRIRARLVEALTAFTAGRTDEPYLQALLDRHTGEARRLACARLRLALECFDTAAIFTIHGFCQRALSESAFAAGQGFERELVADAGEFVEAAARDAWRCTMADASPLWAGALMDACPGGPDDLARRVRGCLGRADARIDAPAAVDCAAAESSFIAAHAGARARWQQDADGISDWLANARLKRGSYPAEKQSGRIAALAEWLEGAATLPVPDELVFFSREKILACRTKTSPEPTHPFFAAIDALLDAAARLKAAFDATLRIFVRDFLSAAREALAAHKRLSGVQTYDDLLADLAHALQAEVGPALAMHLRRRYRAALVDEFQDTDPLQLSIFTTIFGTPDHPLVFVGDPKQAIYGFRGADVFAYLAARERADAGYALLSNRRSDPQLLVGLNALFARPQPFLLDALPFEAARAADMPRRPCDIDDGDRPLTLWTMRKPATADNFTKDLALSMAAAATAAAIARLLALAASGRAMLGERPLEGGDIAVLVRKRSQGEAVRQALARQGIASVAMGGGSIWHSEEAEEIERLLLAVAEPTREGLVRAALATVLLGADVAVLAAWAMDDAAWSARLERFHDDRREMDERGFAAMWRRLLAREAIVPRVLARPDGERRMTNYRHLAELLQAAEHAQALDATGLARFIVHSRAAPEEEEHQLRLESDARLVRIVTIHASKGLQYPVVYCPFLWDGRKENGNGWPVLAHENGATRLDFGSARIAALRRQAELESAAEELRLAYVAVTRAEHRCVIVWGKVGQCERSPLAWLLFGPREASPDEPRAWLAQKLAAADESALEVELDALAHRLGGALGVRPLPTDGEHVVAVGPSPAVALAVRPVIRKPPAPWRIASFSSLAARLAEGEAPDRDALPVTHAVPPAPTVDDIYAFPRGTRAGSCLHALFERCDFTRPHECAPVASAVLRDFGFSPEWRPVLERLVRDVVGATLVDDLTLSRISGAQRLTEVEFAFPLRSAAARAGYMKGFIDLVFHHAGRWFIVDWKSNWLGDRPEDYAPPRLAEAMRAHRYDLQMCIYTAALRRALAAREPALDWQTGFGGVFYLFLRGMRAGSSLGVHFARPDEAALEAWQAEVPR